MPAQEGLGPTVHSQAKLRGSRTQGSWILSEHMQGGLLNPKIKGRKTRPINLTPTSSVCVHGCVCTRRTLCVQLSLEKRYKFGQVKLSDLRDTLLSL